MTADTAVKRECRPRVLIRDDVLDGRVFQPECPVCRWEGAATAYEPGARAQAAQHRTSHKWDEGRPRGGAEQTERGMDRDL